MNIKALSPLRIIGTQSKGASDRASVAIYKPFFLAGILAVITAGCTLGAVAMFGIAGEKTFASAGWTPYILAHANSQLYGWVGFFIMGFALQQHAPTRTKLRLFHQLAYSSLGLMALGIGLRFAAEPLVQTNRPVWLPIGVASAVVQFIAVLLFFINMQATRHRTGEKLPWQGWFVMASLIWLLMISAAEPFVFALAHQATQMDSILFVAEYFPPYRDAQFLGFVPMMIFGVASVKMNTCFGAKPAFRKAAIPALFLWNVGVVARMVGWISYFRSNMQPGGEWLYVGGGMVVACAAVALVISTRVFERLGAHYASHKFVRASFAWLLIAGVLFVLEPVHLRLLGMPFSHAYVGALRHALTVGFISQMILGVGMHVIGRMNDLPDSAQKPLWLAFVLLNFGNASRVFLQIASDYTPVVYGPAGLSGFVELIGLFIWAAYVLGILARRREAAAVA